MQLAFHFFAMLFIVIYQERLSFFQKGCVADLPANQEFFRLSTLTSNLQQDSPALLLSLDLKRSRNSCLFTAEESVGPPLLSSNIPCTQGYWVGKCQ